MSTRPALRLASSAHLTFPEDRWEQFVAGRPDGHLLQSRRWAELKGRFGWQAERIGLLAGDEIVAGGQLLFRRLPWGQSMAYVPKGPLVDWQRPELVRPLLGALATAARRRRAAFLKLEPDLPDGPWLELLLSSHGLVRGHPVQPRSTIHIDLAGGLEAALAGMKQKWRYNVRLAGRKEVTVRPAAAADLAAFVDLTMETGQRDGFGVHEPAYYETAFHLFTPDDTACWLLAEYGGEVLAAVVVCALGGKSWYLWGASSDRERQRMASHAAQWAAMQWAFQKGCRTYDLWGIPDEVGADPERWRDGFGEQEGGLWGVYRFKQGFGGQVVRYSGAWDLVLSRAGYRLYHLVRRARR